MHVSPLHCITDVPQPGLRGVISREERGVVSMVRVVLDLWAETAIGGGGVSLM